VSGRPGAAHADDFRDLVVMREGVVFHGREFRELVVLKPE